MDDYKMYKQIFSLRLAGFIMMNGIPIKRIHHNLKFKNKDVYLFEDTSELSQVIVKYKTLKQTKEKYYDSDKTS